MVVFVLLQRGWKSLFGLKKQNKKAIKKLKNLEKFDKCFFPIEIACYLQSN